MKTVMIARDLAPSKAFELLPEELMVKTILQNISHLGYGRPFKDSLEDILEDVASSDLLLLGMSSSVELAKEEVAAGKLAKKLGIPYGFYADIFNCHNRPWFADLRNDARFLFVINEDEAEKSREVFPNAEIIVSGNPLGESFFFPKRNYSEVRNKLGVNDDEVMIMCPAGKNLTVNVLHFGGVIEAVHTLHHESLKYKVFLALHPGDPNEPSTYEDLVAFSKVPVCLITNDIMSPSDLLVGSDLVIESASTICIEAACQRKPVISFFTEIALKRMEEISGTRNWDPCEKGISEAVYGNSKKLSSIIPYILSNEGFTQMRQNQEETYPEPKRKGVAVYLITETLKKLA